MKGDKKMFVVPLGFQIFLVLLLIFIIRNVFVLLGLFFTILIYQFLKFKMRTRSKISEIDDDDNDNLLSNPIVYVKKAAEYTAPNVSLIFIALLAIGAYFHESHFVYTTILMLCWAALQFVDHVLEEDFKNDIFWGLIGTVGQLALYLFIGHIWSYVKLYIDINQKHLSPNLLEELTLCVSEAGQSGCLITFLLNIKWILGQWTIAWPISMIYTLTKDPFTMFTNILFQWSQRRYMWIIKSALSTSPSDDPTSVLTLGLYVLGYFVIGYLWSHIKLFIDVWQGSLPKKLDKQVRDVYEKNDSYWQFIMNIKWIVLKWCFTWPFSLVYTVFKHPFRIAADFIYKLSMRKYMKITEKAMEWREKNE